MLRHAWRSLTHRPGTTAVAVLCIGLGIGVNTVLFGAIDALLFRPPAGVSDADALVRLRVGQEGAAPAFGAGPSLSFPVFAGARERLSELAEVAAYAPRGLSLGAGADAMPFAGVISSANYFRVLGVRPAAGRFFDVPADDEPGALPVAVLGYATWQRQFGGAPDMIGRSIELNGIQTTIIGVAPRGFVGIDLGEPDVWLPLGVAALDAFGGERQRSDRVFWLQMIARRHPGVSHAALSAAAAGDHAPSYDAPVTPLHATPLRPMFFAEQRGQNPVPAWALGISIAVLLLACATVANLLLARGIAREREIAVQLALGATRRRIALQLLLENGIVAFAAAAAAVLMAWWSSGLLQLLPVPPLHGLIGVRTALFALAAAGAAILLFGVAPALWTARGNIEAVLRRGSRGPRQVRAQQTLTAIQIALSFVLLAGAGLFAASYRNALRIDPGFDLPRLLTVSFDFPGVPAEAADWMRTAAGRVGALEGVQGATTARAVPFYFHSRGSFDIADGRDDDAQPRSVFVNAVGADYFRTFGIGIVEGRPLGEDDRAGAPPVAVVSRRLAREFWREGSPVGACISLRVPFGDACVRIVGVAADVHFQDMRGEPTQLLYLAADQDPRGGGATTLFVRTHGDPVAMVERVRAEVQRVNARMPFARVLPLEARARPQRMQYEVAATLFGVFAALATVIAGIGLYMVIAFIVAQQRRELGVRRALGADTRAVMGTVLARGMRIVFAGTAAGAAGAVILGRIVASQLYGVGAADPLTFVGSAALLVLVALLACCLPALAAARVEPLVVLRED